MRVAGGGLSGRGLLVGMAAGAMLGMLLGFAMSERPRPAVVTIDGEVRAFVMFAGIMTVLGGLAGGVLSRDGWEMLAGAVFAAIAAGLFGVLATLHLKGLIYSLVGVPVGALAVYFHRTSKQDAKMTRTQTLPTSDGLWDREMDR
jgi:hypothetical protein